MADQGAHSPAPPPIDQTSYTIASLPDVALMAQRFVQVSDAPGVGTGLMYSDGLTWRGISFSAQKIRVQTAADGTYTWVYPQPFAVGNIPKIFAVAEGGVGVTDVINAQTDGPPTNTQCKIRVTRTQQSAVSLLGLTILSVPASVGATWVSIVALQ